VVGSLATAAVLVLLLAGRRDEFAAALSAAAAWVLAVDARVRGDIVYFPTPNGGAVWSASSIAYCGALSHNNYDNNVSKLTKNVLDRFVADEPAPLAAGS
jgi:hypothetical protein